MLERKSRKEESLEEYYYDKVTLINSCKITGKDAVDCVIHGIYDNNIRSNAQGSNFPNLTDLLKYLRSISNRTMVVHSKRLQLPNKQSIISDTGSRTHSSENRFKNLTCFNCSEVGHTALRCSKPLKKCDKCSRFGHEQNNCRYLVSRTSTLSNKLGNQKPIPTSQKVLKIAAFEGGTNTKFYKSVTINGSSHVGYVDFGSQCTLIKASVAKDKKLIISRENLPILKGFAARGVEPLGKVVININVDTVTADTEAYVVNDSMLTTDILIGQTFTELPSVLHCT